jgi:hypothetical protein
MKEKSRILRSGWFSSGRVFDEKQTCPRCECETQVFVKNDGLHEFVLGERCPSNHFHIMHKIKY